MNSTNPVTIIVVDDHPIYLQGVVNALELEEGFQIVGTAPDGETALTLIQSLKPDVAIVDINLPGINGQQVAHQANQAKLRTRIILLTAYDDQEQILHAAWAGAAGYCSKEINPACLISAVGEVTQGNSVIGDEVYRPDEFKRWVEDQMAHARHPYSEPGSPFHPLSDREMEVLNSMVKGRSNKEIAALLNISHQTVKNHVTSILRKFRVDDRTQAVVYALKHGWVQLQMSRSEEEEE